VKRISYLFSTLLLVIAALSGCATKAAPDVAGRWRPANRFSEVPQEIPLYKSYIYYATPLDATLKNTLERWSKDSKIALSYQHPSDFTLHEEVGLIRTADLQDALSKLTAAYAQQGVSVVFEQNQIVVRATGASAVEAPPAQ
jgi:hypothetical protein